MIGFRVVRPLTVMFVAATLWAANPTEGQTPAQLFKEDFEDSGFAGRGWYDITGAALSTAERYSGSRSFECRFTVGATKCVSGTPARRLFSASDSVYVSFYIKHSANWVGSGRSYHPHMFLLMTTENTAYAGPAYTHLTGYIEAIGGAPTLSIQDGQNIDESRLGQDLVNVTEQRSVAGCNGDSDGHGLGACYPSGSVHWNGKSWDPGQVFFDSTPGSSRYKGDWHLVEAYFRLNMIVGGKGAKNGVLQYWYDGNLIINHADVVLRTGARLSMKFNHLLMAPWIGDGSPVDQTFWIDELMVATARPVSPPLPPGSSSAVPSAPLNVRISP